MIAKVYRIKENLWAVDEIGRTTLYIYEGSERVLLLDTGFGLIDLKQLVGQLCPGKEMIVANTHAHGDHNSGNGQFNQVFVGRMDEPFSHAPLKADLLEKYKRNFFLESQRINDIRVIENWNPQPCRNVIPLSDGDIIDLGGIKLDVLETPGHTVGSICLWDRANGYLFSGDMVLTWQVWGQLKRSSPLCVYEASIRRLAALEKQIKEVFPSHGKEDNPFHWPIYHLEPYVLSVYAAGIKAILSGELKGKPYHCFLDDGLCALFDIGGMVYDPERLGAEPV